MANYTGIIKWFDNEKGFGFISTNEGNDVFVHITQLLENGPERDLHEGQEVTFDIREADKGPMAINVHKVK